MVNIMTVQIGYCFSLGVLALRHNELKELPDEVGRLESLRVLDLVDNDLTHLPLTCKALKNLQALWLSFRQPPLPNLSVTTLPNRVKALTCCYLPQRGGNVYREWSGRVDKLFF